MEKTIHREDDINSSFDIKIMLRLFSYAKSQGIFLILSILLMMLSTIIDLSVPYVLKVAIDDFIKPTRIELEISSSNDYILSDSGVYYTLPSIFDRLSRNGSSSNKYIVKNESGYYLEGAGNKILSTSEQASIANFQKLQLKHLTAVLAALLVTGLFMTYSHALLLHWSSQKIVYSLRESLFDHLQNMSLSFFDKNPVGRLVTRVSNDMNNINEMFTDVLVTSIKDFFLMGGTIVVMLSINPKLALICLSTLPLIIFSASIFRKKARSVQRDVKTKIARINATLSENINGMKIIQIFNKENSIFDSFDEINKDHYVSSVAETKVYAIFRPSMNLIYSISLSLLIWYGGKDAISGIVELGVLVAFINYTQQFFRPIMDLSEKFNIFQSSMASAERVFMLLDEKNPITNPENPEYIDDEKFEGTIEFIDVWFSYMESPKSDEDYVLRGVSFKVKKSETIALVGATGSGKSTIISLLNRFYDIQRGSILIDGVDIRKLDIHSLRSKIGIVLQDVFLFAGDIKSNIRLKDNSITIEEVQRASEYVNAHTFIKNLPKAYDEPVMERGSTLSAGQRQLLSFARALVFKPKILILDEATSNIDTETELLIQDAIQKMIHNQTTIIVAHRLSTIQHADQIIVMSKGEIREVGRHQELLEREGIYYDLYKLQMKA